LLTFGGGDGPQRAGNGSILRVKLGVGEGVLRRSFNQGNEQDNTSGSGNDPSLGGGGRAKLIWSGDGGLGSKRQRVFVLHGGRRGGFKIGAATRRAVQGLLAESFSNSKLESLFGCDSE
jgi:hypothetical protein